MRTRGSLVGAGLALVLVAAGCTDHATRSTSSSRVTSTVRRATTEVAITTTSTVPASTTTTATSTAPVSHPPTTPAATTTSVTSAPPPVDLSAVAGKTIVIDAGHDGGNGSHPSEISRLIFIGTQYRACDTAGTQTNDGYTEHAYNLDVALRLRDVLVAAGAHVVMVRTTDTGVGPCIDERAYIGNRANAQVGISIHADGGPASGRGFHVNMPANIAHYTDDIYEASHRLGIDIRDAYAAGTGLPTSTYVGSHGLVERSDFGGLNLSDVPKVLFESANMRNATDAALLETANFRQRVAAALAVGLAAYLAGR